MSAAELELASTIVYSDREAATRSEKLTSDQLSQRVRDVKPHFPEPRILALTEDLKKRGVLRSV